MTNYVEAEVQRVADQKLPETTRLALQENEEVNGQLSWLSELTQVLMRRNPGLQDSKSQLSLEVDDLEQMFSKTSRQKSVRKKVRERLPRGLSVLQK